MTQQNVRCIVSKSTRYQQSQECDTAWVRQVLIHFSLSPLVTYRRNIPYQDKAPMSVDNVTELAQKTLTPINLTTDLYILGLHCWYNTECTCFTI